MALVLGVALDPDATSVEARDVDSGELVASGRVAHPQLGPGEDPAAWWRSLTAAIHQAGTPPVAAISVTGGHTGLVLLDGAGVVLRPVQQWDGAEAEAARIREALGVERWARRAGAVPDARTAVTRLAWLRRTDPSAFAAIGTVLLPHDWLTYRLAGRPVTDRGSASCTGMWSPAHEGWLAEAVGLLSGRSLVEAWAERLPDVLEPDQPADWLDAPVFELLGLRGRPLVASGTAEPMAIALALGLARGEVGVALGRGTTVLAPIAEPLADAGGVVLSRADAAGGHLAVAQGHGGAALTSAVAGLLDLDVVGLGELALTTEPSVEDVVIVPGVVGREGGIVTGLGAATTRGGLARATFEGIAADAIGALEAITDAGATWYDHEPIHLAGPTDGLEAHAQVLATLSGRAVVAHPGVLAAAGACVQAAAVLERTHPAQVTDRWALSDGWEVLPDHDPERGHRLAVHAEERDRQRPARD